MSRRPWLKATDQASCAALVAVALGLIGTSWIYQGGLRGRLIDVDRAPADPVQFQLDLNRAAWPEWAVLPGIGETLAKRIVATRTERGGFRSAEDLLHVPGIGTRTLERMRPYLAVPSAVR